ncbi:MAG: aminotransferase class I/II-fold pyridoxal phosphate-dependent enzyme [Candidatus Obscuribacterales bacterium]|nr:aminotransferase class I/II-fold pyridoxal phosphate-dependent enzyme [Candidatus Obscuribacterales bacterium]
MHLSDRAQAIPSSNIRDSMKRVAIETAKGTVVNLAQGLPEFAAPDVVKQAAIDAINSNQNQYCDTWGWIPFREAIAAKYSNHYGLTVDPHEDITVTCGVSEAVNAALLTVANPGDEVIVFEPFYENYFANIIISNAVVRYVKLHKPDFTFDPKELEEAFNSKTRAIIINNPNNPTTRVFTREELELIAKLCQKWNVFAICDEIYEHMVYDGRKHIVMATIPGMEERTFTCSGLSKTYNLTGWRVGWVIAPPFYTAALRKIHDYLTLVAPTPFQIAGVTALQLPEKFYSDLLTNYTVLRDTLSDALLNAGLDLLRPQGTYFILADCSNLGFKNDQEAVEYLAREHRVVAVSGFSFFRPNTNSQSIRFCFAKQRPNLQRAGELMAALKERRKQEAT